jgi:GT2 family glycosyltransferase
MCRSRYFKVKVIFIIVNWNRKELVSRCLASIKSYIAYPHKVVVIDNASSDGSQEMIRADYPDVDLILNTTNLGFSQASNQGLNHCREKKILSDYIIFLNNDVVLRDSSLLGLLDYLDENSEVAAALPTVFLGDGSLQTGVGGYELSLATALAYFFFLSSLFPKYSKGFFISQHYFRKNGQIPMLDWVSGVCLVVRGDAMRKVPGFPEHFFMYAEDLALCRELRVLGQIIYFPHAQVYFSILSDDLRCKREFMEAQNTEAYLFNWTWGPACGKIS